VTYAVYETWAVTTRDRFGGVRRLVVTAANRPDVLNVAIRAHRKWAQGQYRTETAKGKTKARNHSPIVIVGTPKLVPQRLMKEKGWSGRHGYWALPPSWFNAIER